MVNLSGGSTRHFAFPKKFFQICFPKNIILVPAEALGQHQETVVQGPPQGWKRRGRACMPARARLVSIYMYIYVCVCVCVCVYTHTSTHIHMHIYAYTCMHIYTYIYTHTHPHTHTYINICVHTLCRRTLTPLKYSWLRIRMSVVAKLASNLPARALRVAGRPIRVSKETY